MRGLYVVDLVADGVLTGHELDTIRRKALRFAKPATLRGGGVTSLERADYQLQYRLMDGEEVATHVPALDDLYRGALLEYASRAAGRAMVCAEAVQVGVNLNILEEPDLRYEWHIDSNPFTGVLYLSNCNFKRGGRLMFRQPGGSHFAVETEVGQLLLFDGRDWPHSVEAPAIGATRVVAPMNFFVRGESQDRPPGLDTHLYGKQQT